MKLQVVSDLHLEFPEATVQIENPGDTNVLILGGDITTAAMLSESPDKYVPFFEEMATKFPWVIYLMGNHEHYHSNFTETKQVLSYYLSHIKNLSILDKDWFILDEEVGFFGATLWTDCNNNDFGTKRTIAKGLNDYRLIKYTVPETGKTGHLLPVNTYDDHKHTLYELAKFIQENQHLKKIVVCTHHAPSKNSTHSRYVGDTQMNGGYSSDLTEFILNNPQIVLWTHGHTHDSFDYNIGSTRVVCNPAGYQGIFFDRRSLGRQFENTSFNPGKIIEI